MNEQNILQCKNRQEFRAWLMEHAEQETECWVEVRRSRPGDDSAFWYLDAVEEALCFGWIDSTHRLIDETKKGRMYGEWNDYGRLNDKNKEYVQLKI